MSTNLDKLLVVQDRDRKIMRYTREINDLPERRKAVEVQLESYQQALTEADETIRRNSLKQKEEEGLIAAKHEQIRKLREQQLTVKSNDDYRALEKKIYQLEQEIIATEDQQLVLMEQMETAQGIKKEKSAALEAEQKVVNSELAQLEERVAQLEKEVANLTTERVELVADIDPDWLSRYERIMGRYGDFAVVEVRDNICGGCHMKLPPQLAHDARRPETMTSCPHCVRLLYSAS